LDDGLEVAVIFIDAPHSPFHPSPWRAGGLVDQATLIAEGAFMIYYLHPLRKNSQFDYQISIFWAIIGLSSTINLERSRQAGQ
jgi:hypothetical protein